MSSSKKRGERQAKDTAAIAVQAPAAAGLAGAEREPDYTWGVDPKRPVFKCHAREGCTFERLENLPAVLEHELLHEETRQPPRESSILGQDGKPLKVEGDHENE